MADHKDLGDLTRHGRNCRALIGEGYDGPSEGDCNCGLHWRVALATEREMRNAWRKRAEEAESENCILRAFIREVIAIDPKAGSGEGKHFVTADFIARARALVHL